MPLVSVLLPSYNAGSYLVDSIHSVLAQEHQQWELLLVDDGSTDGSVDDAKAKISDERIRWFRQENAGKPAAMNFAIQQARGDYYAIQDADDLSYPHRLRRLVEVMEQQPEIAAAFSGYDLILDGERTAPTTRGKTIEECRNDIERMVMPSHDPTAMYRLSMTRDIQYEPALRQGEGFDYMLRVGERYPMVVVGECLYSYRVHWSSLTRSDPETRQRCVWEVLERACKRRGVDFEEWRRSRRRPMWRSRASARDNGLAAHFLKSVQDRLDEGARIAALRTGWHCATLHPLDVAYLKPLVCAVSPWRLGRRRAQRVGQSTVS